MASVLPIQEEWCAVSTGYISDHNIALREELIAVAMRVKWRGWLVGGWWWCNNSSGERGSRFAVL
jgi:hypothetical protein